MRSAVPPATRESWLTLIDDCYRSVEVASSSDFVPESSSFRLRALAPLPVLDVWSALDSRVRVWCIDVLGSLLAIDADQCWVRRQYPHPVAPPRHRPHSWHQDGALGFDFAANDRATTGDDALLDMVTCWVALTPCGVDAPGLELVTDRVDRLLRPSLLTEHAVDRKWPAERRAHPPLQGGDALVFAGNVLHRTHVTAAMTEQRTSIELRCVRADAIPDRIRSDHIVAAP